MSAVFKFAAVTVLVAFIGGCTSQVFEGYVGKSITEPMLDYGKPTSVFDMPNGQKAFQWQIDTTGAIPVTTPSYATVQSSNGWAQVSGTQTNYIPYSNSCTYTLFAEPQGKDWTVVSFREPRFGCE